MKLKLISIALALLLGVVAMVSTISGYMAQNAEYNGYLSRARANASKEIPYNAYQNYQKAFAIRCEDETIYHEYLEQCKLLGTDYYNKALSDYLNYFPMSSVAYEMQCERLYESGSYTAVITTALEARDKGVATERVRLLYQECFYMLKNIRTGMEDAQSFVGGYARIKSDSKYGYITNTGKLLIAPRYDEASLFMGGSAAVLEDGVWQMVNSLGFRVALTDKPVEYLSQMIGGKVCVASGGRFGYTDSSLVVPAELPYDEASIFKGGVAAVRKGTKWALIDTAQQFLTEYIFDEIVLDEFGACINSGVVFARKDGKYYMMNVQGAKISDQAFDQVQPFADGGLAAVCIDEKWGFVDNTGAIVIEPQYEGARSFGAGLGGVCIDGLWGYINTAGEIRVECQFSDCKPFTSLGIAAVKQEDSWKYVQLLGYRVNGG